MCFVIIVIITGLFLFLLYREDDSKAKTSDDAYKGSIIEETKPETWVIEGKEFNINYTQVVKYKNGKLDFRISYTYDIDPDDFKKISHNAKKELVLPIVKYAYFKELKDRSDLDLFKQILENGGTLVTK